jgi:hypothetical protein
MTVTKRDPAKLTKVAVNLPFGIGSAEWRADPTERRAAWSLYIELATRIAVEPLAADEGLDREALSSLHSLFGITREVLRDAGPDVGASRESVGGIAVTVLNVGLRPFLAKWHPELLAWETRRKAGSTTRGHERAWPRHKEFRSELNGLRDQLERYATALASIAGVGAK